MLWSPRTALAVHVPEQNYLNSVLSDMYFVATVYAHLGLRD